MLRGLVVFCKEGNITGQHEISFQFPGKLPIIRADQDKLSQAFLNVIMNGLQVMTSPGKVTIKAGTHEVVGRGTELWVTIKDTGPGIPDESLAHIFDAFFTTRTRGTGLGLAITRTIVNQHGGELKVASTGAQGTEFLFTFPIATEIPEDTS